MKKHNLLLILAPAMALSLSSIAGCDGDDGDEAADETESSAGTDSDTDASTTDTDASTTDTDASTTDTDSTGDGCTSLATCAENECTDQVAACGADDNCTCFANCVGGDWLEEDTDPCLGECSLDALPATVLAVQACTQEKCSDCTAP